MIITVTVPGAPVPQGSKRHVGGGRIVESNAAALRPWRTSVATALAEALEALDDIGDWDRNAPMEVHVSFLFTRPKAHLRSNGQVKPNAPHWKVTKPDTDKLLRAVADAATDAGIWRDDSQMVRVHADKAYGDAPELRMSVYPLDPAGHVALF